MNVGTYGYTSDTRADVYPYIPTVVSIFLDIFTIKLTLKKDEKYAPKTF